MANNKLEVDFIVNEKAATAALDTFQQKIQSTDKALNNVGATSQFGNKVSSQLDQIANKATETRNALKAITTIDNKGNTLDLLQTSALRLKTEITSVRSSIKGLETSASASKSNNSIFNKYEYDAQQLNKQLTQTEYKLKQLDGIRGRNLQTNSGGGGQNLNLSSFQKQNLFYQANDVATMAALGANPTQIVASQAGQIVQIFDPKQATVLVAKYASLVPILAAGAAAIALTYKITGDIRAEAERRLGVEEKLAVAYGKQVSKGLEITENYRKQGIEAQKIFEFNKFLSRNNNLDSLESLRSRQKTLETFGSVNSLGSEADKEKAKHQLEEASQIREQIRTLEEKNKNQPKESADNAMRLRFEGDLRQLEMDKEAEQRRADQAEKFKKSVEDGKAKIKDFEKTINSVFDSVNSKFYSQNPIALAMMEGDRATKQLQETLKTLPPQLQEIGQKAQEMQDKINAEALSSARIDTKLAAYDLRDQAKSFLNPGKSQSDLEREKQQFESIVNRNIKGLGSQSTEEIYRKSFGSDLSSKFGGNLSEEQKRSIYEVALLGAEDVNPQGSTFNDLNRQSLISTLAKERIKNPIEDVSKTLNEKLEDKLKIIFSESERGSSLADKRIIALTSSLNPSDLHPRLRDEAAFSRESEAKRLEQTEREAKEQRNRQITLQEKIANQLETIAAIAEKEGLKGVDKLIVEIRDSDNIANSRLIKAPTPQDTADYMKQ